MVVVNEIIYGHRVRDKLSSLAADDLDDYVAKRTENARDAEEAIAWTNMRSKIAYDAHHRPITLTEGKEVLTKSHQGYTFTGAKNRKVANQQARPFKILRRVSNLAYKLDVPSHWKIHPVISVTQLEPAPKGDDPYKRTTKSAEPPPVAHKAIDDNDVGTFVQSIETSSAIRLESRWRSIRFRHRRYPWYYDAHYKQHLSTTTQLFDSTLCVR